MPGRVNLTGYAQHNLKIVPDMVGPWLFWTFYIAFPLILMKSIWASVLFLGLCFASRFASEEGKAKGSQPSSGNLEGQLTLADLERKLVETKMQYENLIREMSAEEREGVIKGLGTVKGELGKKIDEEMAEQLEEIDKRLAEKPEGSRQD